MKKAIQSALLGGVMALALAACSSTGTTTDMDSTSGATSGSSGSTGTTGSSATGTGYDTTGTTGTANPAISPVTTPPAAVSSQIPPTSGQ